MNPVDLQALRDASRLIRRIASERAHHHTSPQVFANLSCRKCAEQELADRIDRIADRIENELLLR